MSDSCWGRIRIGGRLPKKHIGSFLAAIKYEGIPDSPQTEEDLRKKVDTESLEGYLELSDGEASYGMFEKLETYCQKHGLTYERSSAENGDSNPEEVYWAPGMATPLVCKTDVNGCQVIDREELLQWIDSVRTYLKKAPTIEKAPLHINSNGSHSHYAKRILATKKVDPLDLLETELNLSCPVHGDVPPLEIE